MVGIIQVKSSMCLWYSMWTNVTLISNWFEYNWSQNYWILVIIIMISIFKNGYHYQHVWTLLYNIYWRFIFIEPGPLVSALELNLSLIYTGYKSRLLKITCYLHVSMNDDLKWFDHVSLAHKNGVNPYSIIRPIWRIIWSKCTACKVRLFNW